MRKILVDKGVYMKSVNKYQNIHVELPELQKILLDAIQSEFLEIQSIEKTCEKFIQISEVIPVLKKSEFVIYSKYIRKSEHKHEKSVFIDDKGVTLHSVDGQEMELYGLFSPCMKLEFSKEYQDSSAYIDTTNDKSDREHYFKA